MGEKMDVSKESFVSSTEEVKETLAADVAAETVCPKCDDAGFIPRLDENEPEPYCDCKTGRDMRAHICNSCTLDCEADCAANEDGKNGKNVVELTPVGEGEVTTPFTSDGNQGPYVTREPDKISSAFIRNLPVPVPDDELADHAKEMARLHHLWVDTKLKQKAFAKSCKGITDKAEEDMVTLGTIIQEGLEERPVSCRWEFDYSAGVKKLRRLDNFQIVDEETLQGDELHLSFAFQKQSEDNVAKFFEGREPETATCQQCDGAGYFMDDDPGNEGGEVYCSCEAGKLLEKQSALQETPAIATSEVEAMKDPGAADEPKEKGPHACKVCGFDTDSHIYLVRHLRDIHGLKLSEYKAQYPVEK